MMCSEKGAHGQSFKTGCRAMSITTLCLCSLPCGSYNALVVSKYAKREAAQGLPAGGTYTHETVFASAAIFSTLQWLWRGASLEVRKFLAKTTGQPSELICPSNITLIDLTTYQQQWRLFHAYFIVKADSKGLNSAGRTQHEAKVWEPIRWDHNFDVTGVGAGTFVNSLPWVRALLTLSMTRTSIFFYYWC